MTDKLDDTLRTNCVPIIPLAFFPYPVKVIASDTSCMIEFESQGLLYETGDVVIERPFKDEKGNVPASEDDGAPIDLDAVLLANGHWIDRDGFQEVAEAPSTERRLAAAIEMLYKAAFEYGQTRFGAGNLDKQAQQARVNLVKLLGLDEPQRPV